MEIISSQLDPPLSSGWPLESFLLELQGSDVVYCPNPGNAGDSLLALAAYQLFEKLNIDYRRLSWNDQADLTDAIVIYGGGGNLVGMYPQAHTFIRRHHRQARRFILLPCTVRKNDDLLGTLGSNVDVICRERVSYDYVGRAAPRARLYLMDDLALTIDADRLVRAARPGLLRILTRSTVASLTGLQASDAVPLRTLARCLKERAVSGDRWQPPKGSVLHAFRTDREKPGGAPPKDNVDISRLFAFGTDSEVAAAYAASLFLAYIDRYEEVRTNRLHVCIGAALLGKQVDFFPNSYFKNEAVFEFSLRDRYPKVRWHGGG